MLTREMKTIIENARGDGWVLEPDAKRLLQLAGIAVPRFFTAASLPEATAAADRIGYPLVAKIVSPKIVHKTEADGVALAIGNEKQLTAAFDRLQKLPGFRSVLIEETVAGIELIIGAKMDEQFGPVVLLGIGGTAVEIYQDSVIRMAPVTEKDVDAMVQCLKGGKLLHGYRGKPPANMEQLRHTVKTFSELVCEAAADLDSVDLNPVMCSTAGCLVADARIMLRSAPASSPRETPPAAAPDCV
jgi:succinyl-CoA synthetase beta subunit